MNTKPMQAESATANSGGKLIHLRKILAPVDFSEYSAKALDYVRAFACQFDAEVVLVHVVEPTVIPDNFGIVPPSYDEMSAVLARSAGERLARLAEEAALKAGRVQTLVRTGRAPWEVVQLASEIEADLIIITTHGYSGLKRVLMGSTAELIVRHAPCPVLTVRSPEHDFVRPPPPA
jgi:universal stress protein A